MPRAGEHLLPLQHLLSEASALSYPGACLLPLGHWELWLGFPSSRETPHRGLGRWAWP